MPDVAFVLVILGGFVSLALIAWGGEDGLQARSFTERVMAAIPALSGQRRVDLDAAELKAALRLSA